MTPKPLKRHKALQPLSREHHHGLLLSWKIRMGFRKGISSERISKYAHWFFKWHLLPHFEKEEQFIFPILEKEHELIKKALADHRRIKHLFAETEDAAITLSKIEEELDSHIRFEERILFPEIQKEATELQLKEIEDLHSETDFTDNLEDEFWK